MFFYVNKEVREEDKIIQELTGRSSFKSFFKENLSGILTTIIFHMVVFIFFLVFKINAFRNINELGVVLDFDYQIKTEEEKQLLSPEEIAKLEFYERILERAMRTSTQPVNVSEQLEKQINTKNFVEEVESQLDQTRSEEEKRELERMEKILATEETIYPKEQITENRQDYQGPTLISYEFLEEPFNRYRIYMPVPVYKCQGEGTVEVDILVDQSGSVISAKPVVIGPVSDGDCLAEAAVKYAILSRFSRNLNSPKSQKGKIKYTFVAQ